MTPFAGPSLAGFARSASKTDQLLTSMATNPSH
jgi:hypothetical protein